MRLQGRSFFCRSRGKKDFRFTVYGLLVVGVGLFVVTAVLGGRTIARVSAKADAQREALNNLVLLEQTFSLLKDVETGQRGFIITGKEDFLTPYHHALAELPVVTKRLLHNVTLAPEAGVDRDQLEKLIDKRIEQAATNVRIRRASAAEVVRNPEYVAGRITMEQIRQEFSRLRTTQLAAIDQMGRDTKTMERASIRFSSYLTVLGVVLLTLVMGLLIRERQRRDTAEQSLRELNETLEHTVVERTDALQTALTRIQGFAAELDANTENERRRLAREIHDQLGQVFTALNMLNFDFNQQLASQRISSPKLEESLTMMGSLLNDGAALTRKITAELRPPLLDDLGLAEALHHLAQTIEQSTDLTIDVSIQDETDFDLTAANHLFRIVQESLTNVMRHASARYVEIRGERTPQGYRLIVQDDGEGPGSVRLDASGLRNMSERTSLLGGKFSFRAAQPHGSLVSIVVPLKQGLAA